jgi:hypothetical protein
MTTLVAGDKLLGKIMTPHADSIIKHWNCDEVGWQTTANSLRKLPEPNPTGPIKTSVKTKGKRKGTEVALFSNRTDVQFSKCGTPQYKFKSESNQTLEAGAATGVSARFNPVFQSGNASLHASYVKSVSDGESNLVFEVIMPMIEKEIELTEEELAKSKQLETGNFVCFAVRLGATAKGTIKKVGGHSNKLQGRLDASADAGVNPARVGTMSAGLKMHGSWRSKGPEGFALELSLNGGPQPEKMCVQRRTVEELWKWFSSEWSDKVAQLPESWVVLRAHCHGDENYINDYIEKIKQDRKIEEQEAWKEALKASLVNGNPSEIALNKRNVALHVRDQEAQELLVRCDQMLEARNRSKQALKKALVDPDTKGLMDAMNNFEITLLKTGSEDPESALLLREANARIDIGSHEERMKERLNEAKSDLLQVRRQYPGVNIDDRIPAEYHIDIRSSEFRFSTDLRSSQRFFSPWLVQSAAADSQPSTIPRALEEAIAKVLACQKDWEEAKRQADEKQKELSERLEIYSRGLLANDNDQNIKSETDGKIIVLGADKREIESGIWPDKSQKPEELTARERFLNWGTSQFMNWFGSESQRQPDAIDNDNEPGKLMIEDQPRQTALLDRPLSVTRWGAADPIGLQDVNLHQVSRETPGYSRNRPATLPERRRGEACPGVRRCKEVCGSDFQIGGIWSNIDVSPPR